MKSLGHQVGRSTIARILCRETGEEFDVGLTKAEASERSDEFRARSPRLSKEVRKPEPDSCWRGLPCSHPGSPSPAL